MGRATSGDGAVQETLLAERDLAEVERTRQQRHFLRYHPIDAYRGLDRHWCD